MRTILLAAIGLAASSGCVGTTGGDVVDFPAAASGPVDADALRSTGFVTDRGWHVVLTKATLHVGAMYLTQSRPVSGAQVTDCVLPGTYVAQVTTGRDVDLLSPLPQRFPTLGHGTTLEALVGQIWLASDADHDLDDPSDTTPILVVEGAADRAGDVRPFSGTITIADNRVSQGGSAAGSNTFCKQRIVSPIPASVAVQRSGGLLLRVDPRQLFVNVDFAALGTFSDDPSQIDPNSPDYYSQPSANLYQNLHAIRTISPLYSFTWDPELR